MNKLKELILFMLIMFFSCMVEGACLSVGEYRQEDKKQIFDGYIPENFQLNNYYSYDNEYVIKNNKVLYGYDKEFNLLWKYDYIQNNEEWDVSFTKINNDYLFSGEITTNSGSYFSILRINSEGSVVSKRSFSEYEPFGACKITNVLDDGYVLNCERTLGVNKSISLLKVNKDFEIMSGITDYYFVNSLEIPEDVKNYFTKITKYSKMKENSVAICGYVLSDDQKKYECKKVDNDVITGGYDYKAFDSFLTFGIYEHETRGSNLHQITYKNGFAFIANSSQYYDKGKSNWVYTAYYGKYDLKGNLEWEKVYNNSILSSINKDVFSVIDVNGQTSNYTLVKYDDNGKLVNSIQVDITNQLDVAFLSDNMIVLTQDGSKKILKKYDGKTLDIVEQINVTEDINGKTVDFVLEDNNLNEGLLELDTGYMVYNKYFTNVVYNSFSYVSNDGNLKIYYNSNEDYNTKLYIYHKGNTYDDYSFFPVVMLGKKKVIEFIDFYYDLIIYTTSFEGTDEELQKDPTMIKYLEQMQAYENDPNFDLYISLLQSLSNPNDLMHLKDKISSFNEDTLNELRKVFYFYQSIPMSYGKNALIDLKSKDLLAFSYDEATDKTYVTKYIKPIHKVKLIANGGTIDVNKDSFRMGDVVNLDIKANKGYTFKEVKIIKKNDPSYEVYVFDNKFYMPDDDVVITALFDKNPENIDEVITSVPTTDSGDKNIEEGNPNTGDGILKYFLMFIISFIVVFSLILFGKTSKKGKSLNLL